MLSLHYLGRTKLIFNGLLGNIRSLVGQKITLQGQDGCIKNNKSFLIPAIRVVVVNRIYRSPKSKPTMCHSCKLYATENQRRKPKVHANVRRIYVRACVNEYLVEKNNFHESFSN